MRSLTALRALPVASFGLLLASLAGAADHANVDRSFDTVVPATAAPVGTGGLGSRVISIDDRTGAPAFLWGMLDRPGTDPEAPIEDAARAHLRAQARLYGLSDAALNSARVARVHDTGRGGIVVVFRQEVAGAPLLGHEAKVLMRRDRALVAIGGNLRGDVASADSAIRSLAPEEALARSLSDRYARAIDRSSFTPNPERERAGWSRFDLAVPGALTFDGPARVRPVVFPVDGTLVPAYQVEFFSRVKKAPWDAFAYVIDGRDGRLLQRRDLTSHAEFVYRVWADSAGDKRPLDGPVEDFTPHPTGEPDGSFPGFVASSLVSMEGFNQFGDPWLADGATETRGNNVDAYTDHDDSNTVSGDTHGLVTAPGEFDHTYDPLQAPTASSEQEMAAVTQLFYTTNWLHDYWYDSGFDEEAGNAQVDNYGRGGEDNDALRCEAQDALDDGAANNANMATPGDGASPRMQMFVWSGAPGPRSLTIDVLAQTLETNIANFGPDSFDLTAEVVLADDGAPVTTNACEAVTNDVVGKIALVDRGDCTFQVKVENAEAAGAVGVLLANNQAGSPPFMPGGNGPTIPVMSISQADGTALKSALANGPVNATLYREATVDADGTIDNMVIAHEWGHYLHHRLVDCGLNQCGGQSEGWGDFLALTLVVREGDDLSGSYADSLYATLSRENGAYFGIRRAPYSTDFAINPLTFQHIQVSADLPNTAPLSQGAPNNAEVHNAGEVWASMMFEGYAAMLGQSQGPTPPYSFDEARRRMSDYIVAGMLLAPVEPTFTEQRDALIAAAYAADPADAQLIAEGFAKRGAGSCAISPPRGSFDNEGVVESFDVAPAVTIVEVTLGDGDGSCDDDGVLDRGELGRVDVSLANMGYLPATATAVTISSATPGVSFPNGNAVDIPLLEGFGQVGVSFDVEVAAIADPGLIDLEVTAVNAASCTPMVIATERPFVNFDTVPESSTTDDFESSVNLWDLDGEASELIWSRQTEASGNNLWHGVDYSSISDTSFESPELVVATAEPLVLSFRHRFKFEASESTPGDPNSFVYCDGGVIEIRAVGGSSWEDVSEYVDPDYVGTLGNLADNPLSDRDAYAGESEDYPEMASLSLDFGDAFAGETVKFRFRIGTDQAASDIGWEIDDVAFSGIVGTPFPSIVPDAQTCSEDVPPVAIAGDPQSADEGDTVTLDGSASGDLDGDELTFKWTQLDGPAVDVEDSDTVAPTFVAPPVAETSIVRMQLEVTSNGLSDTDVVEITIVSGSSFEPSGGCDCSVPEEAPSPKLGWAGLVLGLAAIRRRIARPSRLS